MGYPQIWATHNKGHPIIGGVAKGPAEKPKPTAVNIKDTDSSSEDEDAETDSVDVVSRWTSSGVKAAGAADGETTDEAQLRAKSRR